jgi:hypothetical protein
LKLQVTLTPLIVSTRQKILDNLSKSAIDTTLDRLQDAVETGQLRRSPPTAFFSEVRNRALANNGVIKYTTSHDPAKLVSRVATFDGTPEELYNKIQAAADESVAFYLKKKGLYDVKNGTGRRFITVRPDEGVARTFSNARVIKGVRVT